MTKIFPAQLHYANITSELVCLHEAGHATVAVMLGLQPTMELLPAALSGKTSVPPLTEARKKLMAAGGFAAEMRFYMLGRLVDDAGQKPADKQFIDAVHNHAADDKPRYFGFSLREWPEQLDTEFQRVALGLAYVLEDRVLEALATKLLNDEKLDWPAVKAIAGHLGP